MLNVRSRHPFLVFGPPGTGKTRTVCEAIKQLWLAQDENNDKALIIVAAPSNTAIDIIAKDLIDVVPQAEILRLASLSHFSKLDKKLAKFSAQFRDDVYEKSSTLRILCGTLQILGKLDPSKIKATHIIVDEAGQSTGTWPVFSLCIVNKQLTCQQITVI